MGVWYCRREDVQAALDSPATLRTNQQIDRLIEAASRQIEGRLNWQTIAPTIQTVKFDWPNSQMGTSYRLWLDENPLISASSVTAGGATIPSNNYILEPQRSGPPYNRLEILLSSTSAFNVGSTSQQDISITGTWGFADDLVSIGTLSSSLSNTAGSTANATWNTPRFGVGDILLIDSERVIITGRNMSSSSQTLQTSVGATMAETTIAVANGPNFLADTVLLIDSERMLVTDVSGNNLIVKRAWDGTTLAAHTNGATIYTYTGITLDRAKLGTTIATHSNGATVFQWQPPALLKQLCIGIVLDAFEQEQTGFARTVGAGETLRNASGAGLAKLWQVAMETYARQSRLGVV